MLRSLRLEEKSRTTELRRHSAWTDSQMMPRRRTAVLAFPRAWKWFHFRQSRRQNLRHSRHSWSNSYRLFHGQTPPGGGALAGTPRNNDPTASRCIQTCNRSPGPLFFEMMSSQQHMGGRLPRRGGPRPRLIHPGAGFARPFGFGGLTGFALGRGLRGFGGEFLAWQCACLARGGGGGGW